MPASTPPTTPGNKTTTRTTRSTSTHDRTPRRGDANRRRPGTCQPPSALRDPRGRPAGPLPVRPRPDDRGADPATHRLGAEGHRLLHLGGHRLPADQHGHGAHLREALRPVWPQADADDRHRSVPRRLNAVRPEPDDVGAYPLPLDPGLGCGFALLAQPGV